MNCKKCGESYTNKNTIAFENKLGFCSIECLETYEKPKVIKFIPSKRSLTTRITQAENFLELLEEKLKQIPKEAKTIHEKDKYELDELHLNCFEELEQYFDPLKKLEKYLKNLKDTL